jgi:light-independent protochlorophyllide reductase subunit B
MSARCASPPRWKGVHYVLHAPQGDTYADLLFTMIERREAPAGHLHDLPGTRSRRRHRRTVQDACRTPSSASSRRPSWSARPAPPNSSRTIRAGWPCAGAADPGHPARAALLSEEGELGRVGDLLPARARTSRPPRRRGRARCGPPARSCNILGPTALGFRHRDDVVEIGGCSTSSASKSTSSRRSAPRPSDLPRLADADFNVVLYPEIAGQRRLAEATHGQPFTKTIPRSASARRAISSPRSRELAGIDSRSARILSEQSRLPWYSRSVDSTYLTGKRVFIFGDATHAIAAAASPRRTGLQGLRAGHLQPRIRRETARGAAEYGVEPLITDDYLEVEDADRALQPELVLGTQMERHIAKRLGIPCAVISAPVHVQDFPARYSPQMGFEGANVIFDTWVHPLMMGLEEHLLAMFREDFEFTTAPLASRRQSATQAAESAQQSSRHA